MADMPLSKEIVRGRVVVYGRELVVRRSSMLELERDQPKEARSVFIYIYMFNMPVPLDVIMLQL